nr:reverse transcriptase domain-containing protein [Tanacetum cinerariifolium]
MADNRTMAKLLQAPTEDYADAIVIPEIAANNFELKHGLINLVLNTQFFEHDKEDPHAHIRFIELCCGWKFLGQNAPRMLEDNREQVQSSSIMSQGSRCQDKNNQSSAPVSSPTPAPVKAVEPNCVTCGGSGTLPSNTITNPKEELKVSAPIPNLKSSIPYPSRHDNERRRDQANEQIKKFYEIFKDMSFEISFTNALILMPKFASTLKALIGNKEKLSEMARTPMNEHCSAVILNKLPRKLGVPGKFIIPCEFPGMDECLALTDLGASINLMPLFVWEALSLPELTLTCMTLELADRSVSKPIGIAKDVSFKGEQTLRIENKAITYNLDQTVRYSANYNQMTANKIDVIEMACEEYSQEVLSFSDVTTSGNPTPHDDPIISTTSPTLTPFRDSDFLLFEEADAFLSLEDDPNLRKINPFYYDPEGDILLLEAILNSEPLPSLPNHEQYLPSFKKELKVCEAKTIKSSVDEPPERRVNPKIQDIIKKEVEKLLDAGLIYPIFDSPWVSPVHCVPKKGGFTVVENEENELIPTRLVTRWRMLERLAGNEYYCFLDGFFRYFQIPIDLVIRKKQRFTCPYGTFAYRRMPFGLYNAPGTFQRCMLAIFHDMVEKTMKAFMDGNSFENCLFRLDKMLQRCEDTNLSLNWEKSHFMVKEGIVLGHKISKNKIEVDRAKVNVIAKLPHPTTVKAKALPTNDARVVCKFLKSFFAKFGAPRAIISDCGTHFCNDQFAKVMLKYGVTHRLSIAYCPQTSGQVEVSNRGLKRIFERTIGENRAS